MPPRVDPPDLTASTGGLCFQFDRAGVRLLTLAVSAYIDARTVVTDTYRNTSLIRTLRERWNLGSTSACCRPNTAASATSRSWSPRPTRRSTCRPRRSKT